MDHRHDALPSAGRAETSIAALITAGLGAGLTTWYVAPGFPSTLVNLGIACAILAWPLCRPWPLTRRRLKNVAVWWLAGGLLGGYVFGLGVVFAGLIALLALPLDDWLVRRSSHT